MILSQRQPDGATLREHLQAGARNTGQADPRLTRGLPGALLRLWEIFVELSGVRQVGFGALSAIPPSEIEAWQRLHRLQLLPWEVETLQAMDRAAMAAASKKPGAA